MRGTILTSAMAKHVVCPKCDAQAGQPCVTAGQVTVPRKAHRERFIAGAILPPGLSSFSESHARLVYGMNAWSTKLGDLTVTLERMWQHDPPKYRFITMDFQKWKRGYSAFMPEAAVIAVWTASLLMNRPMWDTQEIH